MRNSTDGRLLNAIRNQLAAETAAASSQGHSPALRPFAIAKALIAEERELIEQWTLEKIAAVVQRQILAWARPRDSRQDFLPGFRDLAEPLPARKGVVPLGQATIQQLRDSVKVIRAQAQKRAETRLDARIGRLKRLIIEMAPYARMRHGLTVADYCELRAHGVTPARVAKGAA